MACAAWMLMCLGSPVLLLCAQPCEGQKKRPGPCLQRFPDPGRERIDSSR